MKGMVVKIQAYGIALVECVSGPVTPLFYYNHVRDTWVREFQGGCTFFSKEECEAKSKELNIFGTEIISGHIS